MARRSRRGTLSLSSVDTGLSLLEMAVAAQTAGGIASPTLGDLTLDDVSTPEDTLWTANIIGRLPGSTIDAVSSDATVLSVVGSTVSGTFTTPGTPDVTLTETLAGATNTPHVSPAIEVTVLDASGGLALSAPVLTRTTGATEYPPEVSFTRPIDWQDGDIGLMQRSEDPTFGTGVSEATQVLYAATTTYDFDLDTIVADSWFIRMAAYRTAEPASLNWSNIVNVGDTVAPTITSSSTPSSAEDAVAPTHALTADEPVTWAITGGADAAAFSLAGSTLTLDEPQDYEVDTSLTVEITATDYAGNATPQTITWGITDIDEIPAGFTFTDITGATTSTVYTSNEITVSGLAGGVSVPVTISGGTYQKNNAGGFVSSATTAVNGDIFEVQVTSSGAAATGVSTTLTIGGVSDTYTVTTTGFTPADLWLASEAGDWWDIQDLSTMWQDTAGTTPAAVNSQVKRFVGKKNGTVLTPNLTNGPVLRQTGGGNYYLEFGGPGASAALRIASLQVADTGTGVWSAATGISVADVSANRTAVLNDDGGSNRIFQLKPNLANSETNGFTTSGTGSDTSGQTIVANTPYSHIGIRTAGAVETFHNGLSNGSTTRSGTIIKTAAPFQLGLNAGTYQTIKLYSCIVAIGRTISAGEITSLDTYITADLS